MSGLLQRLADQALGAQAQLTAPQIRPAMGVHAQVPMGLARDDDESQSAPRLLVVTPGPAPTVGRPAPTARTRALQPVGVSGTKSARTIGLESPAAARLALSFDSPRERPPAADVTRIPPPLLGEAPVATALPAVGPVTTTSARSMTHLSSDAGPEPTEVHVHIGRIEVTATPEPAALKKPRAVVRNALPLSDYLAGQRRS